MSVAAPRLVGRQSPTFGCKQLLLGPPPATSRVVRERLRTPAAAVLNPAMEASPRQAAI
jgi:hypothetical protein